MAILKRKRKEKKKRSQVLEGILKFTILFMADPVAYKQGNEADNLERWEENVEGLEVE